MQCIFYIKTHGNSERNVMRNFTLLDQFSFLEKTHFSVIEIRGNTDFRIKYLIYPSPFKVVLMNEVVMSEFIYAVFN